MSTLRHLTLGTSDLHAFPAGDLTDVGSLTLVGWSIQDVAWLAENATLALQDLTLESFVDYAVSAKGSRIPLPVVDRLKVAGTPTKGLAHLDFSRVGSLEILEAPSEELLQGLAANPSCEHLRQLRLGAPPEPGGGKWLSTGSLAGVYTSLTSALTEGSYDVRNDQTLALCEASFMQGVDELHLTTVWGTGLQNLTPHLRPGVLRTLILCETPAAPATDLIDWQWLSTEPALDGIRELRLDGMGLGDDGLKLLLQGPHLRSLEVLSLARNGLTLQGLAALATSPTLSQLRRLELSGNRAEQGEGHVRAAVMLASSPHLTQLEWLGVADCDMGELGVAVLSSSERLPWLSSVEWEGSRSLAQ